MRPPHTEARGPQPAPRGRAEPPAAAAGSAPADRQASPQEAGAGCARLARWATLGLLAGAGLTSVGISSGLALAPPSAGQQPPWRGMGGVGGLWDGRRARLSGPDTRVVARAHIRASRRGSREEAQSRLVEETAAFRGQKYFISHNHSFTGPWTEERFFDHWRATRPELARLYIPIGWTGSEVIHKEAWKRLNDWALGHILRDLDTSCGYFTVIQIAKGFENNYKMHVDLPPDLDLTVFATGPTSGTRVVPLPLLKEEMQPAGLARDIKVSFTGTYSAHPARQRARELYQHREGWLFEEPHGNWAEISERSRFVLCPRGWGVTSFRLYESLQLGAIPIYVHDDEGPWLPYSELVDWQTFSLVLHERDLPQLGRRIDDLEAAGDTPRMLAKVAQLRRIWTYDFMNRYIVETLREEDPGEPPGEAS